MVSGSTLLVEQEYRATTTVIEAPIEDMISTGTRLDNKRMCPLEMTVQSPGKVLCGTLSDPFLNE